MISNLLCVYLKESCVTQCSKIYKKSDIRMELELVKCLINPKYIDIDCFLNFINNI